MTLPKWATTVTPLSKTIALTLFIALPIVAFYFGLSLQPKNYVSERLFNYPSLSVTPEITSVFPLISSSKAPSFIPISTSPSANSNLTGCQNDSECVLYTRDECFSNVSPCMGHDFSSPSLEAFSTKLCTIKTVFPGCFSPSSHEEYRAKCINNLCIKIKCGIEDFTVDGKPGYKKYNCE